MTVQKGRKADSCPVEHSIGRFKSVDKKVQEMGDIEDITFVQAMFMSARKLGLLTWNVLRGQENQDILAHWNNKLINQLFAFIGEDIGEDDIVDTVTGSLGYSMISL